MSNTTTPTPAEQLASDIDSLQSEINSLQHQVKLSGLHDTIEDLNNEITSLKRHVQNLRDRGYVFEKGLEGQVTDLTQRWQKTRPPLQAKLKELSNGMETAMRAVESQMTQLATKANNPTAGRQAYNRAKAAVENLEGRASAAESTVRGLYDSIENDFRKIDNHLRDIEWMIEQIEEASFSLLPTEAGIMAVEATWLGDNREDKEDPKGILLLTDQRLLFEQKQEIATKKVLFITTKREKVQKLAFEVKVALVESANASKQGMFKNEDHIELKFASGAPTHMARFHLFGQDCNEWQALINKAKIHDFDKDRAVAIDEEAVEKVKAAPTQCPSCGGKITEVVTRGMDSITCKYCGSVIRL